MLADGFLPCLPGKKIAKLKLQTKHEGFNTDDFVAFTNDIITNNEHKLLAQIKHKVSITNSDKQFQEVINAAWADFNNNTSFAKDRDVIVLITGPLSKSDIFDTRTILDWARHLEHEDEFFNIVNLSKLCSNKKREKIEVFKKALEIANGGNSIPDKLIFSFLRHFHILGYDLDIKNGVIHSLLTSIINNFQPTIQADFIWSKISETISSYNQNAGTITKENFPEEITRFFKKEKINVIPEEFAKPSIKDDVQIITNLQKQHEIPLFIASILGGWNENSSGDNEIISEVINEF